MSGSFFRKNISRIVVGVVALVVAGGAVGVIQSTFEGDDTPAKTPASYGTVKIKERIAGIERSHMGVRCNEGQELQDLKVPGGISTGHFEAQVAQILDGDVQKKVPVTVTVSQGSALALLIIHAEDREVGKLDPMVLAIDDQVIENPTTTLNANGDSVLDFTLLTDRYVKYPHSGGEITGVGFCIKETS